MTAEPARLPQRNGERWASFRGDVGIIEKVDTENRTLDWRPPKDAYEGDRPKSYRFSQFIAAGYTWRSDPE